MSTTLRQVAIDAKDKLDEIAADVIGRDLRVFSVNENTRMWARGDGCRYKELSRILIPEYEWDYIKRNYPDVAEKFSRRSFTKYCINKLLESFQFKKIGKIKGEFGSSDYYDTYSYRGMLFINYGGYLVYGSRSILRNSDVWMFKKD